MVWQFCQRSSVQCEIFIVSYAKDFEWLRYCIESIYRFGSGFSGLTVLAPEQDNDKLLSLAGNIWSRHRMSLTGLMFEEFPGKGMCDAMAQKMMADLHCPCPGTTHILHVDSDCVFREPFTPDDYFVDGKPVLLCERYSDIAQRKDSGSGRFQWQAVVEKTLGWKPEMETMCRHPMVNPVGVYPKFRAFIEERWKMPFRPFVLIGRNEFPQEFAEFNTLGAWVHAHCRDQYFWVQLPDNPRPKDKLVQFWGHGSPWKIQSTWIDNVEQIVVPELFIKSLLAE